MGHIVNAKSMRIGRTTVWCDQWYSEKLYYPEFLHAILRLRLYCFYVFQTGIFEKKGIFYSHFEILQIYKKYIVELFFYDGRLESEFEDFKMEYYKTYYYLDTNQDPETRLPFSVFSAIKFMVLMEFVVPGFSLKKIEKKNMIHYLRLLRKPNTYRVSRLFSRFKFVGNINFRESFFYKKRLWHLILFFLIYINIKLNIARTSLFITPNRNSIFRRFYFFYAFKNVLGRWVAAFGHRMERCLNHLHNNYYPVNVRIFLVNNNCVNAKFLSRFIAKKIWQGMTVKDVLNPIRRELLYLMAITSLPVSSYFNMVTEEGRMHLFNIWFDKSLYKNSLSFIFNNYFRLVKYIFYKENTYITIDLFIMFMLFYSKKKKANNNLLERTPNFFVNIAHNYFTTKIVLVCFFEHDIFVDNVDQLFFPKIYRHTYLNPINKYQDLYNTVYIHFFVNKHCLTNNNYFIVATKQQFSSVYNCGLNWRRFLNYRYWSVNYKAIYTDLGVNFLKSRIKIHTKGHNLIGYKMYLRGRFKRKQRAGHWWFSKGKTPLNTLSAFIDYSYFVIPIVNSTISVKVWLYKSHDIDNTFYLRLF